MLAKSRGLVVPLVLVLSCAHASTTASPEPAPSTVQRTFRRIVTGADPSGRSTIIADGPVPERARLSRHDFPADAVAQTPFLAFIDESDGMWFGSLPADLTDPKDPVAGPPLEAEGFTPRLPPAGYAAAIVRWLPGGPDFPLHASRTVDLVAVVSGAMELRTETASTVVRAGDVVVQRGTAHTWKVVGDEPCVAFMILLDAAR